MILPYQKTLQLVHMVQIPYGGGLSPSANSRIYQDYGWGHLHRSGWTSRVLHPRDNALTTFYSQNPFLRYQKSL